MLVQEPSTRPGGCVGHHWRSIRGLLCHPPPSLTSLPSSSEGRQFSQWVGVSCRLPEGSPHGWATWIEPFFVMLNPGDLLTGFGLLPHFTNTVSQRIAKLLTQAGEGQPGFPPASPWALQMILFMVLPIMPCSCGSFQTRFYREKKGMVSWTAGCEFMQTVSPPGPASSPMSIPSLVSAPGSLNNILSDNNHAELF